MNESVLMLASCLLVACSNATPSDTVGSLVAHPDRLRKVEQECRDDFAGMGAAECNAAAEARRRVFVGNGPQYTPPKESPKF